MLDEALTRLREISSEWFVVLVIAQRAHAALRQGDLPGAARWFTETIGFAQKLQLMRVLLSAVTGLAGVALALGEPERAARLLGAVESAREALGLEHIQDMHHVAHINATIRAGLETVEFERAWVAGHVMSLEDAVADALAIADGLLTEAIG